MFFHEALEVDYLSLCNNEVFGNLFIGFEVSPGAARRSGATRRASGGEQKGLSGTVAFYF